MAKTKTQERAFALLHDYQATFGTPTGKRVLRSLMKRTGFLQNNFVAGDSHGTAFNEGATSIVRFILGQLKWDIKKLEAQLSEAHDEDELQF